MWSCDGGRVWPCVADQRFRATLGQLYYFIAAPTLVFAPAYPRYPAAPPYRLSPVLAAGLPPVPCRALQGGGA